jgi:4-amino-4-deoxy-L-arabinose transferase-like glycosyltransferase
LDRKFSLSRRQCRDDATPCLQTRVNFMKIPYKGQLRQWWDEHFPVRTQHAASDASQWTRRQWVFAWLTLLLTSLVVLLPNLRYPLIEPDETRYAQIAIEMIRSRDWVTPTLDGHPYLDKPPLMYWLTAMSFQIFGTNEIAARLPSILAAFVTIILTFGWGSRIVGRRPAWLGALSLSLCGGFVLAGRFLILDSLLALLTTSCLLSGYIAVRGRSHRPLWWMVSGVACALGVLTKGPVALVLCAPPLVVSGWLRADHSRTRLLHWVAFLAPMFAVCVPWYLAVAKYNPEFAEYFFWEHNYQRFLRGSNHEQPVWFYVPVVLAAMFPVSLLLPSVGVFLASRRSRKRVLRSKDLGFLFCGSVWILAFFSAASCKLPTYILPAIPLICLTIGVMLDQTVLRRGAADRITTFLRPFPQRATLILVAGCVVVIWVDVWIEGRWAVGGAIAAVSCMMVLAVGVLNWNRQAAFGRPAWAFTAVVATGVLLFASSVLLPSISNKRSVFVETRRIADANPNARIVFFGEKTHGALFHLSPERTLYFPTEMEEEFIAFFSREGDLILVADEHWIEHTRTLLLRTHQLSESPNHKHVYRATRIVGSVAAIAGRHSVDR